MKQKVRFLKKQDIFIILIIILAAALLIIFLRQSGKSECIAKISVNSKEVMTIELFSHKGDEIINLDSIAGVPVTLEVTDNKIRFINSKCPDHICEGYGYISDEYQSAICMPYKTVVNIYPK